MLAEKIVKASNVHAMETGKKSNIVFLGKREIDELWALIRSGNASQVSRFTRKKEFYGHKVIEVVEDSFLYVGWTPPPLCVKCALWDADKGRVISEWMDVEMFVDVKEGVARFQNKEAFVFDFKESAHWSGHLIVIFPGDPDRPHISKVVTNGMPLDGGITFNPGSITME